MPGIPELERLRQEDHEWKASLDHRVRFCLQKKGGKEGKTRERKKNHSSNYVLRYNNSRNGFFSSIFFFYFLRRLRNFSPDFFYTKCALRPPGWGAGFTVTPVYPGFLLNTDADPEAGRRTMLPEKLTWPTSGPPSSTVDFRSLSK